MNQIAARRECIALHNSNIKRDIKMFIPCAIPKIDDGSLFHFTTAKSLIEILSNMTLKSSLISRMNDLNECDIDLNIPDSFDRFKIKKYIQNHCRLISFSKNYKNGDFNVFGYKHPRMWAQYANNNTGACLVLNEKYLLAENADLLKGVDTPFRDVKYENPKIGNKYIYTDEKNFVENYHEQIFFNKHIDWKQEDERRFFCIDGPETISINGCVEYIVLGKYFDDKDYSTLVNKIVKREINLMPRDFARQINIFGNLSAFEDVSRFIDYVKDMNTESKDYLCYLRQNGYDI